MRLVIVAGACGSGKTTVIHELRKRLDSDCWACLDTDQLGINWWDYAGTDHESRFSEDCLREAVKRAGGRDLVFGSCLSPQDYIEKTAIPDSVESTCYVVLCPPDEIIERRLYARPKERGFTTAAAIRPHIEYNRWFKKNKGKFPLFLDTGALSVEETVERILPLIRSAP